MSGVPEDSPPISQASQLSTYNDVLLSGGSQHVRGQSLNQETSADRTSPFEAQVARPRAMSALVDTSHLLSREARRLERRRNNERRQASNTAAWSWRLPTLVDMRMLDYITECDENLICPICRCPFVDPVILNECDHCFCRDCIRQTWSARMSPGSYNAVESKGDCPTCRTPAKLGLRSTTSKVLTNILDDMLVKCPNHTEGCTAVIKRSEAQDHIDIYCGWTEVECPAEDCTQLVCRRESGQDCLHYRLSCAACREEMQKSELQVHWRKQCPERQIKCQLCEADMHQRDLARHEQADCPAFMAPCPGVTLGCTFSAHKDEFLDHTSTCTFAKLTPIISAQTQRLNEQEIAQKQMSRKLNVFQENFTAMHKLLYPEANPPPSSTSDTITPIDLSIEGLDLDAPTNNVDLHRTTSLDNTPPFTSPHHHLLSLHEGLRAELSRTQAELHAVDARHSTHLLNETLRLRDEAAYTAASVAGLQRQVHWLTSVQLQASKAGAGAAAGGPSGAARAVQGGERSARPMGDVVGRVDEVVRMIGNAAGVRRGSEEGRTKL